MARGVKLSTELIAAIQADYLTGASNAELAIKYGIHEATLRGWKRALDKEELTRLHDERKAEIDTLLHEYKVANLKALKSQAGLAADIDYLRVFPPTMLAVVHGVMADKIARLSETHEPTAGTTGREDATAEGAAVPESEEGSEPAQFTIGEFADSSSTAASPSTDGD